MKNDNNEAILSDVIPRVTLDDKTFELLKVFEVVTSFNFEDAALRPLSLSREERGKLEDVLLQSLSWHQED